MIAGQPFDGLNSVFAHLWFQVAVLTGDLASVLLPVLVLGIVLCLGGLLLSQHKDFREFASPLRIGLLLCLASGGALYLATAVGHYAAGLCL